MSLLFLVPLAPCCNFTAVGFYQLKGGGGGEREKKTLSSGFSCIFSPENLAGAGGETRDITTRIEITPTVTFGERAAFKIIVCIPKQEPGSVLSASCVIPAPPD